MPLRAFSNINPDDHEPGFMDQIMQMAHRQRVDHLSKNPHLARSEREHRDIELMNEQVSSIDEQSDVASPMSGMSSLQMAMQLMKVETEGVESLTQSEQQQLEKTGVRFADFGGRETDTGHTLFTDNIEECDGSSDDSNPDSEDEYNFGRKIINLEILNFGDKSVLKKLTTKQTKSLNKWLVKYRTSLRKFSKIINRFEKFVELTSDKNHPYHNEGLYIEEFLDNKLTGWVDDDVKYFETYFTEEMPLFSAEMKFKHGKYRMVLIKCD